MIERVTPVPDTFAERFSPIVLGFNAAGHSTEALWQIFQRVMTRRGFATFDDLVCEGKSAVFGMWSEALTSLPPFASLLAGASVPIGAYAVVDYLAASCDSMAEGVERLARYFKLIRPGIRFVLEVGDVARVDFVDERPHDTFFDEWTTGVTIQRFRVSTGKTFPLHEARFRSKHDPGPDVDRARAFLGCEPTMGARVGGFSVDLATWNAPLVLRNERMRESLEAHAERLLRENLEAQGETQQRVREAVARELRGGDPSVQSVAKKLAMTPRTLQRRLSDEGVSYQSVVDALRAELADRYIEGEGLSITEVAFLLGYAEASSFARAYRRWKGKSPIETRRDKRDAQ